MSGRQSEAGHLVWMFDVSHGAQAKLWLQLSGKVGVLGGKGEEDGGQYRTGTTVVACKSWEGDLFLRNTTLGLRGTSRSMSNDMGSREGLRGSGLSRLGGHMDRLGLDSTWPPWD